MAVDIDSLQIEIEATSSDAAKRVQDLADALQNLKSVAKGGAGLTTVSKQLQALASAAASLNNTGIGKLKEIAPALNSLFSIQKSSGLNSTINALKKLPEISASLKKVDLGKFADQMNQVAAAVRPLATEMQKVSNGFSAFPVRIQKIIQSNAGLAASNNKAAKSFGVLGTGISSTTAQFGIYYLAFKRVADVMSDWIKSANDYIENVNLFQVSMGEFYDEAFAYAQLLNDRLGIDPSEWMRAQGVFMSMANGFGLTRKQAYDLSEGLTELAYDLSSLYNEDTEQSILRLQSALSGEIEPIRRLGISISQATLQEYALAHGIDESVAAMTEQEKALLRSLVLMEGAGRIGAIGDFARTLESPANALRVLNQQITQLGRALGTVLLPIIIQIIPWVQAFVEILTDAISALATFVGFTMPEWDANDWGDDIKNGADSITDSMGNAGDEAKQLKNQLLGIDELNILKQNDTSSANNGNSGSWTEGLEIPNIWDQDAIAEMTKRVDEIKPVLKDLLENYILPIGMALASWKIAKTLSPELKALNTLFSSLMISVGIPLMIEGITEVLFGEGLTWESILNGGGGGLLAGAGIGSLLAKKLGLTWAGGALVGGVVGLGLTLMIESIISQVKNGLNIGNMLLGVVGGALAGAALGGFFAWKMNPLFLARGLIGGLVAGVGLTLLISSVISIIQDGLNIGNGIMGVIGGALSGLGIGTIVGGGAKAAFGLIIGVGLSLVIEGLTAQISSGAASLSGGLMTILGSALAGAGIGSVIPVIGTAAGAVIGLGVGVVLEILGIQEAGKVAYEASEDFQIMQNILDRCAEASDRTAQAFENLKNGVGNLNSVSADFAVASQLVEEIYAINENANASAYELEQMAVKVDVLNGLNIDGLSLSIDETTKRVTTSKEAVMELIASLEQEARMEAMRDLLVQSYKDQYQALSDMIQAAHDYDAANQALAETQNQLNELGLFELQRRAELKAAEQEQTSAVEAATETYQNALSLYGELDSAIGNYTSLLTNMKLEEAGLGQEALAGLDSVAQAANSLETSIDFKMFENIGKQMASGIASGFASSSYLIQNAIDGVGGASRGRGFSEHQSRVREQTFSMPRINTITPYATGGFPEHGEMFIAREQGPELVGQIGNRTAVANNDQIISGIASANQGVINAVMAIGAMITKAVNDKDTNTYLDGRQLSRGLYAYNQQTQREKGTSLVKRQ